MKVKNKFIITTTLATVALLGTAVVAQNINEIRNEIVEKGVPGISTFSSKHQERADTDYYSFSGNHLLKVDEEEFTFDFIIRLQDDGQNAGYTIQYFQNNEDEIFKYMDFTYNVEGIPKTVSLQGETTDPSYYTIGTSWIDGDEYKNTITIYDPDLIPNSEITKFRYDTNSNEYVSTTATNSGVWLPSMDGGGKDYVITDNTGAPIELVLVPGSAGLNTGDTSVTRGWYMPEFLYVDDSLTFDEVNDDSIVFSYTFNGTKEESIGIVPFVTYDYFGLHNNGEPMEGRRVLTTEFVSATTNGSGADATTEYVYRINGQTGLTQFNEIEDLYSNWEYGNIHVYKSDAIQFIYDKHEGDVFDNTGVFLDKTIISDGMALEPGVTLTTLGLQPEFYDIQNPIEEQQMLSFDVAFDAAGIKQLDGTEVSLADWVEYEMLDETLVEVGIADSSQAAASKEGITLINASSWRVDNNKKKVIGSFTVSEIEAGTSLTPGTSYDIYVDPNNTIGTSLVDNKVGTLTTEDYDPLQFTSVAVSSVDYRSIVVELKINENPLGELLFDEFNPSKVTAYKDVPLYNSPSDLIPDNKLKMTLLTEDPATSTYTYEISNLNPNSKPEGETYNNIRFAYEDGPLNPQEVSLDVIETVNTKPLELVYIETDILSDTATVHQTSSSYTDVNIRLPGLVSSGNLGTTPEALPLEAYQDIEYGPDGNLQFALLDPTVVREGKIETPTSEQILSEEEVVVNTPTTFTVSLATRAPYIENLELGEIRFDLAIGTRDTATNEWVWVLGDSTLSTEAKFAPTIEAGSLVVDQSSITQNSATIQFDIIHGSDDINSSYIEIPEPETSFDFKVQSPANPLGEQVGVIYNGEVAKETGAGEGGLDVISTYEFTINNLRAETSYTSVGVSIMGGKFEYVPVADLTTLNRNMVKFDGSTIFNTGTSYNSIEFTIDATTGGNYKELADDDLLDLEISINTTGDENGWIDVDEYVIELTNRLPEVTSEGTSGYYEHTDFEETHNYTIHLNLDKTLDNSHYTTPIHQIKFTDTNKESVVTGRNYQIFDVDPITWTTTPRTPVQFVEDSQIIITTPEGQEENYNSFEFTFMLQHGEQYLDFNPITDSHLLTLRAKEGPIQSRELEIHFIEEIDSEQKDTTHTYRYEAVGLKPNTTYSNLTLKLGGEHTVDESELFEFEITTDSTFTTSPLRTPVLDETFNVVQSEIGYETFVFSISATKGAEEESIKDDGFDVFDPEEAYLGYKGELLIETDLETEYLDNRTQEFETYTKYFFEVSGLDPATTYENLYFNYNGNDKAIYDLSDKSVTTKQYRSPFDPANNPVEFNVDSITSDSFEFSIGIIETNDASYSGFSENETILFANNRQLKTTLLSKSAGTEDIGNGLYIRTYTYEVSGLDDNTTYENFAVVVNAYGGARAGSDAFESRTKGSEVYYTSVWEVPYFSMRTLVDISNIILTFVISTIMVILLIIIFIIYFVHRWWVRHISLSVYDDRESFEVGMPIYRLINGKRHHAFWNSYVDNMKLYASGEEIESKFIRVLDEYQEPTGDFQIILSEVVHNPDQILHIFNAIRYDSLEISWDRGKTIHPLHSLKLRKIAKAEKAALHRDAKFEEALKLYDNVSDKKAKRLAHASLISNSGAFIIPEHSVTSTTAIYEQILPKTHPILKAPEIVQQNLQLYHQVDDKLYPIDTMFVGNEGAIFRFKLSGLQPAKSYVNIHWTIDDGKTLIPSKIMHFETKDELENQLELINTDLVKVDEEMEVFAKPLSTPSDDSHYTGKYMTTHAISIAAQKHIQRDTGEWVPEHKLEGKWNQYLIDWYGDDDIVKLENIEIDLEQEHNLLSEVSNSNEWWERTIETYLNVSEEKETKKKKTTAAKKNGKAADAKKPKKQTRKQELQALTKAQLMDMAIDQGSILSVIKGYKKEELVDLVLGGEKK